MNYQSIIETQRNYFNSNETKNLAFRIKNIKKLKQLLIDHEQVLLRAVYDDFKKSKFEAYSNEIGILHSDIDEAIKKLPKWSKARKVSTNLPNLPGSSFIIPEPLGVVLVIGAWNYPIHLCLAPVIAAMAAGNTIILKPSEISANTSGVLAQLINDNYEKKYFHVIEGGIPETTSLLEIKFDKILFTGSTTVGRIVYQAAAKHLTPITLELGGKSPVFVFKDCNLKQTVKRIIWGKFLNAGQTCIAPDYILVEESIREEFLKELKSRIELFDYAIGNGNYVQIINDDNFNRLNQLIDKDKLYYGGQTDEKNRVITPTILSNIHFDHQIMEEEIFGPILPVISFTDLDRSIKQIKNLPKPLACYIFSKDSLVIKKILHELSFGGGAINDVMMHFSNNYLPFGGVGESGTGNYHSEAGFKTFSHFKSVLKKPFWGEPNIKYSPYSKSKLNWIKRILNL